MPQERDLSAFMDVNAVATRAPGPSVLDHPYSGGNHTTSYEREERERRENFKWAYGYYD